MNHLKRHGFGVLLVLLLTAPTIHAADVEQGRALYEKNCVSCHDASVFTRADRRVKSFEGLVAQVQRCDTAIGLRWFEEDVMAVAEYLNRNYYKFQR